MGVGLVLLDDTAEFQTVHFRHHNVRDDDVDGMVLQLLQGLNAVLCSIYAVGLSEIINHKVTQLVVILDDENLYYVLWL